MSRRFLLVQLQHMGDVVLATPAARAVRTAEPGAVIHFLTGPAGAQALAGNPHVDRVIEHRHGFRALARQVRALRRERYDVVVDFHSVPRTALLVAATAAPLRIGVRGRGPRNAAYTRLLPRERAPVYMARQKMQLLEAAGIAVADADARPHVHVPAAERGRAAQLWASRGLDAAGAVAAISAVSKLHHKQWGAERWAAVADGLLEQGVAVVLTHGPGEEDQVAAVAAAMRGRPVTGTGVGSIAGLAALYERCDLWLGNDGGPKHVAAAVGTPTIAVARWGVGPVWNDAADPRQRWFDAAPAGGCDRKCDGCRHLGCLAATTPGDVLDAAAALLRQAR